jgi:hypothetical protein
VLSQLSILVRPDLKKTWATQILMPRSNIVLSQANPMRVFSTDSHKGLSAFVFMLSRSSCAPLPARLSERVDRPSFAKFPVVRVIAGMLSLSLSLSLWWARIPDHSSGNQTSSTRSGASVREDARKAGRASAWDCGL